MMLNSGRRAGRFAGVNEGGIRLTEQDEVRGGAGLKLGDKLDLRHDELLAGTMDYLANLAVRFIVVLF